MRATLRAAGDYDEDDKKDDKMDDETKKYYKKDYKTLGKRLDAINGGYGYYVEYPRQSNSAPEDEKDLPHDPKFGMDDKFNRLKDENRDRIFRKHEAKLEREKNAATAEKAQERTRRKSAEISEETAQEKINGKIEAAKKQIARAEKDAAKAAAARQKASKDKFKAVKVPAEVWVKLTKAQREAC